MECHFYPQAVKQKSPQDRFPDRFPDRYRLTMRLRTTQDVWNIIKLKAMDVFDPDTKVCDGRHEEKVTTPKHRKKLAGFLCLLGSENLNSSSCFF